MKKAQKKPKLHKTFEEEEGEERERERETTGEQDVTQKRNVQEP